MRTSFPSQYLPAAPGARSVIIKRCSDFRKTFFANCFHENAQGAGAIPLVSLAISL